MSALIETLQPEFQDKEYRHAYVEECLNAVIAAQIKTLREQRGMTQKELADAMGMKQSRIPLLEDASYENWTVNTLKRFAKAFDVALSVQFDTFSSFLTDFENLTRESLERQAFADDRRFRVQQGRPRERRARHRQKGRRFRALALSKMDQNQLSHVGTGRKRPKSVYGAAGISSSQAAAVGLRMVPAAGGIR